MEAISTTTLTESSPTLRCQLAAWTTLAGDPGAIATWRRQSLTAGAGAKPASFLKQADDQTVLAVRAVLDAIDRAGWPTRSFADWGVVAGASFFGRTATAHAIHRFLDEGAWCVSPHLVPNQSLHAPAGAISLVLKIHGPNFGVGSGANAAPDALLLAAALLADGALPGLWVVLTAYDSEWLPGADGSSTGAPVCRAVALALTPVDGRADGPLVTFGQSEDSQALLPELHVGSLAAELGNRPSRWRLADLNWVGFDTPPGSWEGIR